MIAFLKKIFKQPPAEPGGSYGAPGQGRSTVISLITTLLLILVWLVITTPMFPPENVEMGDSTEAVSEEELVPFIRPLFLPSPQSVLIQAYNIWNEEFSGADLKGHIGWSMFRVFGAFFLGVITGIPIGIMMGINRFARGIFDPPIEFYRPIPPLAYLPLIIIWFGIDESAKIILIYLAIFAPMVLSTRAGVKSVPIEQIHAAYSMGASKMQIIFYVILKGAMPEILTGLRIGIGFGWTTLVAAELVAAEAGLGAMIKSASDYLVTDVVIMGIIVIGLIAYVFDMLMRYLETVLVPWKGK